MKKWADWGDTRFIITIGRSIIAPLYLSNYEVAEHLANLWKGQVMFAGSEITPAVILRNFRRGFRQRSIELQAHRKEIPTLRAQAIQAVVEQRQREEEERKAKREALAAKKLATKKQTLQYTPPEGTMSRRREATEKPELGEIVNDLSSCLIRGGTTAVIPSALADGVIHSTPPLTELQKLIILRLLVALHFSRKRGDIHTTGVHRYEKGKETFEDRCCINLILDEAWVESTMIDLYKRNGRWSDFWKSRDQLKQEIKDAITDLCNYKDIVYHDEKGREHKDTIRFLVNLKQAGVAGAKEDEYSPTGLFDFKHNSKYDIFTFANIVNGWINEGETFLNVAYMVANYKPSLTRKKSVTIPTESVSKEYALAMMLDPRDKTGKNTSKVAKSRAVKKLKEVSDILHTINGVRLDVKGKTTTLIYDTPKTEKK